METATNRASALRRIAAFAVDYGVLALYVAVLTAVSFALMDPDQAGPPGDLSGKLRGHAVAFVTLTLPVIAYFALCEASPWQGSVGKRVLGLKVVSRSGDRLGLLQAFGRNALKFAPWEIAHIGIWYVPGRPFLDPPSTVNYALWGLSMLLAAWFVASLWTRSGRTPYDLLAGTRVAR